MWSVKWLLYILLLLNKENIKRILLLKKGSKYQMCIIIYFFIYGNYEIHTIGYHELNIQIINKYIT
jgi:hypothetical protein